MKHCPFPTWLSEEFSKTLNFIHNIHWQKTNPPAFETVVLGGVGWYYITSRGHVGCHQGRVPSFLSASPVRQWMLGHRGAQRTKGARPEGGPQSPHEPTIRGSGGLPRTSLRSPGDDVLRAALRGHGWHSTKELHGSAHLISGKHGLVVFICNRTSLVRAACSEQDHTAHTRRLHETETELSCWLSPVSPWSVKLASSFRYADNLGRSGIRGSTDNSTVYKINQNISRRTNLIQTSWFDRKTDVSEKELLKLSKTGVLVRPYSLNWFILPGGSDENNIEQSFPSWFCDISVLSKSQTSPGPQLSDCTVRYDLPHWGGFKWALVCQVCVVE